ncbi:MAG TPA: nucleotidyltransferase domain-containing protein [Terriglobales bacterium]|nr:nucleotidyltransferase domain-containing protein [Terriglobales bacterium]
MVPEKQINEFVSRLREQAGTNLQNVILYGSAAQGKFHPDFSNVNLLCVLRETSFAALTGIAPVVKWWTKQKHHAPLILTQDEIVRSADVFSIEMLDIKRQHRVLFGDDVLSDLQIPMQFHRAQVEYELREKLILLRQHLMATDGNEKQMWDLLLRSLSSFTTLFRHGLIALGDDEHRSKRETIKALSARIKFDSSAFLQLLDIRERNAEANRFDVKDLFTRYLNAVQQVTAAVDTMLD